MSSSKLTLIGFHRYFQYRNDDLFKYLELPEGIEKEVLTDNILLRGGEFEVYYADAEFIQQAIGVFAKKNRRTFEKWIAALNVEYNPLENYDRMEEYTDTTSGNNADNSTTNTATNSRISAFNSDSMRDNTSDSSNMSTGSNSTFDTESKHVARLHGNIGVTTSQQMLESELDIARWNIYEQITDLFLNEFTIPIYI